MNRNCELPAAEAAAEGERSEPDLLNDDIVFELADLFRLFGDSTRIRLLWALKEQEKCVQNLSGELGISVSAVSHQLKLLRDANLICSRRDGKNVYYSLCDEHVHSLLNTALTHLLEKK